MHLCVFVCVCVCIHSMEMAGTIRAFPKEKTIVMNDRAKNLYGAVPYFLSKVIVCVCVCVCVCVYTHTLSLSLPPFLFAVFPVQGDCQGSQMSCAAVTSVSLTLTR